MAVAATTVWEVRSTATAGNVLGGGFNPSNATVGTDYSQRDTEILTRSDLYFTSGTTLKSDTHGFTAAMCGNLIHIISGDHFTAGWYEIVTYVDQDTVTLNSAPASEDTSGHKNALGYVGGALSSFNCVGGDARPPIVAGNIVYIKAGTYDATTNTADYLAVAGTSLAPIQVIGYSTTRAADDTNHPALSACPLLQASTGVFKSGTFFKIRNIRWLSTGDIGSAAFTMLLYTSSWLRDCEVLNTYTTSAARHAIGMYGSTRVICCEASSRRGIGIQVPASQNHTLIDGCYVHDCEGGGIAGVVAGMVSITNNVIETCGSSATTGGIQLTNSTYGQCIANNTIRNCTVGIYIGSTVNSAYIKNNIIADCYVAANAGAADLDNLWLNNNIYGNTSGFGANIPTSIRFHDTTANPVFTTPFIGTPAGAVDGSTSTPYTTFTATNALTATITPNVDTIILYDGTNVTKGVYLITGVTDDDSLTVDRACATGTTTNIKWGIIKGGSTTNLSVGLAMAALGSPSAFPGCSTTSYIDLGAAQRQEDYPVVANVRYGIAYGNATYTGLIEMPNEGAATGTQDATSDALVKLNAHYGSPERHGSLEGGDGDTILVESCNVIIGGSPVTPVPY